VVEIAEELIEAVQRGQEFVTVTEVVLAELPGGVALLLEHGGNGGCRGRGIPIVAPAVMPRCIRTDIPHTDVVAHDDDDVGFLIRSMGQTRKQQDAADGEQGPQDPF